MSISDKVLGKDATIALWNFIKSRCAIPTESLTKGEWESLDDAQKDAEILYLIKDGNGDIYFIYKRFNIGKFGGINNNLLDNWYFLNPVNRKGRDIYSASLEPMYSIDRWQIEDGSTLYITKDGIGINSNKWIKQIIYNPLEVFIGQTITFSVLHNFGLDSITINMEDEVENNYQTSFGGELRIKPSGERFEAIIRQGNNDTIFKAAKLEFGDRQTLAYEKDGIWILNEIPKYSEQYLTCKLYDQITGEFIHWSFIGN